MSRAWLTAIVFFMPVYIARIFVGTYASSYAEMPQLSLGWLGYACNFLLLAVLIYYFFMVQKLNKKKVYVFVSILSMVVTIEIVQLFIVSSIMGQEHIYTYIIFFGRVLLLLIVNFAFMAFFFDKAIFLKVFEALSVLTIFVSFSAFSANLLFGSDIQLHIGYGYPRVQGLLSEPSALAGPLSAFASLCLLRGRWTAFGIATMCAYLSHSPIVYLAMVISISFTLGYLQYSRMANQKIAFLVIYLLPAMVFIVISLSLYFEFQGVVISYGSYSAGLSAVWDGLKSLWRHGSVSDEIQVTLNLAQLDRVSGLYITISELIKDGVLFVGYGLNGTSYVFTERFGETRAYGLIAYIIASYGLVLGPLLLVWVFSRLLKLLKKDIELGVVGMSFFIAVLGNSAGGIIMYGVVIALAFRAQIPGSYGANTIVLRHA